MLSPGSTLILKNLGDLNITIGTCVGVVYCDNNNIVDGNLLIAVARRLGMFLLTDDII